MIVWFSLAIGNKININGLSCQKLGSFCFWSYIGMLPVHGGITFLCFTACSTVSVADALWDKLIFEIRSNYNKIVV